jgi:hypothetical protein
MGTYITDTMYTNLLLLIPHGTTNHGLKTAGIEETRIKKLTDWPKQI